MPPELSKGQLIGFYGGLPLETTVRAEGAGWFIETPCLFVPGTEPVGVLVQGGIHTPYSQLSHKVRGFVEEGFPVICISQSGAAGVKKSPNFYDPGDYSRFIKRDLAVLRAFKLARVIAYGSSIGAAAAIALAAEAPKRVAAVIAVNPSSLVRQNKWLLAIKFILAARQKVEIDFTPPPRRPPSPLEIVREMCGKAKDLNASDIGLWYLLRARCPVRIYTGREDGVFPWWELRRFDHITPRVQVKVLDNFVHSDPNSERQFKRIRDDALDRI